MRSVTKTSEVHIVTTDHYLKEYTEITIESIKNPSKFFEKIKTDESGYLKPLFYALISYAVYNIGLFLWVLFSPDIQKISYTEISNNIVILILAVLIFYIVTTALFLIFYIALMQLAVRMVGGKGKFKDTFKVICYSYSPLNFAWIFGLAMPIALLFFNEVTALLVSIPFMLALLASVIYIFYIAIVGLSITSEISKLRAFAAFVIQMFLYSTIAIILIFGFALIYAFADDTQYNYSPDSYTSGNTYDSQNPYKPGIDQPLPDPVSYNTKVYFGGTPDIDGITDASDSWHEGNQMNVESRGKYYTIITKHDYENIYILMEWDGTPEWNDEMAIYFEQDNGGPDQNIDNGLTDCYYQGSSSYGPSSLADAHYDQNEESKFGPGYLVTETFDGKVEGKYNDGRWKLEWKIPLNSGDPYDISIDEYPTELGFSIVNWKGGAKGIWPPDADPYLPETWGTVTIVDGKIEY